MGPAVAKVGLSLARILPVPFLCRLVNSMFALVNWRRHTSDPVAGPSPELYPFPSIVSCEVETLVDARLVIL